MAFINPTPGLCHFCKAKLQARHTNACALSACQRKLKQLHKRRDRQPRELIGVRQCPNCLAWSNEVAFETLDCCSACYQTRTRFGQCERCKDFLHADGCYRCHPPEFNITVLWTSPDGRMRTLYRRIVKGKVKVANKSYLVKSDPLTIVVEVSKWLTVRN